MPVFSAKKLVASAASGHVVVSDGPSDVCLTPAAPSPVPVPYPNVSPTSLVGSGYAARVLVGGAPAFTRASTTARSTGDEAGTVGGVLTGRFGGPAGVILASPDVKAEGHGVARTLDAANGNR